MSARSRVGSWAVLSGCVALANCGRSGETNDTPGQASASNGTAESSVAPEGTTATTGSTTRGAITHTTIESSNATASAGATTSNAMTSHEATSPESTFVDSGAPLDASTTDTSEAGPVDTVADAGPTSEDVTTSGPDTREVDCATVVVNAKLGKIPTVGVVTFSTDFHIDSANVEFAPVGEDTFVTAAVDLAELDYKTYLLGMKPSKEYIFRVVISADGKTCTSADQTLTTGVIEQAVWLERAPDNAGSDGFVVTTTFNGANGNTVYIFDTDGDVVWAYPGLYAGSRARLDWNGKNMWSVVAQNGDRRVLRVSLDGEEEEVIEALPTANHDLTVLPNGHIAVITYGDASTEPPSCARVLDYDPVTKTARPIVADVATLFQPHDGRCHTNALTYQEPTNTFIISDLDVNLFVKFSAVDGTPIWQLGGANPIAPQLVGENQVWEASHGHHLTEDGRFVFYNNLGPEGASAIWEFQIDEEAGTASGGTYFSDTDMSGFLGDVQILKNGNLWVTCTSLGEIREYDAAHEVVAEFRADVGYSYFMQSLYEKPYGK